ncbi:MAG: phospholipase D-like domain-containing protein, partial [Polyangiaceae bacterium]
INAIKAQESAGHDVKIVLDGSTTNKSFNTSAYNGFNAIHAGTAVWSSSAFTYTHEKCVIIDSKQAWIMTMNLNTSSPDDDREYLAIDTDTADVTEATSVFQADFTSSSITPSGSLVVASSNARPDLVALIGTATSTLDMELEEFSDMNKNGIVDAVVAAAQSGVKVRIVIANNSPDADQPTAISDVKAAGGSVAMFGGTSSGGTSSHPYVAAKTILVDCGTGSCTSGYVGSENMTAASLGHNRELGVIFSKASELAKIYTTVDSDFKAGTPQ